jgi:hypothetical protein
MPEAGNAGPFVLNNRRLTCRLNSARLTTTNEQTNERENDMPTETTEPTPSARIVNRHMRRLLDALEDAGCAKVFIEAVASEMRWLRSDLDRVDEIEAERLQHRKEMDERTLDRKW